MRSDAAASRAAPAGRGAFVALASTFTPIPGAADSGLISSGAEKNRHCVAADLSACYICMITRPSAPQLLIVPMAPGQFVTKFDRTCAQLCARLALLLSPCFQEGAEPGERGWETAPPTGGTDQLSPLASLRDRAASSARWKSLGQFRPELAQRNCEREAARAGAPLSAAQAG